jgi:hypothetical protein
MKILYLSSERNIDLAKKHEIMYLDHTFKVDGEFPKEIYDQILEFKPEILLEREFNNGMAKYPDIVSFVNTNFPECKKAIWLIDSHCNLQWHLDYSPLFDYVFIAVSKFQPVIAGHLKTIGSKAKCFWLPLCYPYSKDRIKRNKSHVPFDIVFVGRWGRWFDERTRLLDLLKEQYGDRFFNITDYANMEEYLRQGIISFNRSILGDMNFRVFETLANGVELVTDDVPDLHLINGLVDRINIYHNDQELLDMCDDILDGKLENDVIRSQIWIQNHHCLIHRHNEILKMIATGKQVKY